MDTKKRKAPAKNYMSHAEMLAKKRKALNAKIVSSDELAVSRNPQYGTFADRASLLRTLKDVSRDHMVKNKMAAKLSDSQEVALGEIFNKITRIINGDPNKIDTWADIAGYATLITKELEGDKV